MDERQAPAVSPLVARLPVGVDTQLVLPFGTPQQVSDEVKRRIDDLASGGGFVFATVHNVQALVPAENVVAAFDTAVEYGRTKG